MPKRSRLQVKYDINYTNLSFLNTFSFYVSMTIPREFDRVHKREKLTIEPIYGRYEFFYQIDKQNKDCGSFVPELDMKIDHKAKEIDSIFYSGKCWKINLPKKSQLIFKNITDK